MSTDSPLTHAEPSAINAHVKVGDDKEPSGVVAESEREDAEWRELEVDELRSKDIDAIAEYLRESGQASA